MAGAAGGAGAGGRRWRALMVALGVVGLWAVAGTAKANPSATSQPRNARDAPPVAPTGNPAAMATGPGTTTPTTRPSGTTPTTTPTGTTPTTTTTTTTRPVTTPPTTTPSPTLPLPPSGTVIDISLPGARVTTVLPPLPLPLPELTPLVRRQSVPQSRPRRSTPRAVVTPAPGPPAPGPRLEPASTPTEPRPGRATAPRQPQAPARSAVVAPAPTLAATAGATAKKFSFPLALTGVVVVFLLLQVLVDRRDPKLVAAPMVDDLYMFR